MTLPAWNHKKFRTIYALFVLLLLVAAVMNLTNLLVARAVSLVIIIVLALFVANVAAKSLKSRSELLQEISTSEKKLRENLESVPEELVVLDAQEKVILWNDRAELSWHRTRDELLGNDFFTTLPQFASETLRAAIELAVKENRGSILENLPLRKVRGQRFYQVRVFPWSGGAGLLMNDVTPQHLGRRDQAGLIEILESTTDLVSSCNPQGEVKFLNQAFRKSAGISRDEDISKLKFRDFHPNWEKTSTRSDGIFTLGGNQVWSGETSLLSRNGAEIPLSQVIIRHKNPSGEVTSISAISRDISAYKEAEKRGWQFAEELNLSQKKFQALVNSVDGIVWEAVAETGAFTFVSRRAKRILGYPVEQWLKDPGFWIAHVHPEDATWLPEHRRKELARTENPILEYRMISADGRTIWVRDYTNIIKDELQPTVLRGIMVDISSQKKASEDLANLNRQLVETSRMAGMAEVATGVLHNVGNVLNSVNVTATLLEEIVRTSEIPSLLKVSQLLQEHKQDIGNYVSADPKGRLVPDFIVQLVQKLGVDHAELGKECEQLVRNVEHIKEIVAMQQNFARVTECLESVSISDLADEALKIDIEGFKRHGVEIIRQYANVPLVAVDKHKALQILVNLVYNAKHALDASTRPDKKLVVTIAAEGNKRVKVVIQDNGIGIPPENLTKIFSHGFTTKKEGHGFGLHSGANAAKEMGGTLVAHSEGLGKGATFSLEFPLANGKAIT